MFSLCMCDHCGRPSGDEFVCKHCKIPCKNCGYEGPKDDKGLCINCALD